MNSSDQVEKSSAAAAPLRLQLSPEFVRNICSYLYETGTGRSTPLIGKDGILFGCLNDGLLTVETFEPLHLQPSDGTVLPTPDECDVAIQKLIADSQAQAKIDAPQMVGWYSIHSFASTRLTRAEIDFHNSYFQRSSIGLIFTPEGTAKALVELYYSAEDAPLSEQDCCSGRLRLDFELASGMTEPLDLAVQHEHGDLLYARVYDVLSSLEHKSVLEALEPSARGNAPAAVRRKLPLISAAALALIAAAFAFAWLRARANLQTVAGATAIARPVAVPEPAETGFGMRVQSQGDGLLVSWNRQLPAVKMANSGVLLIQDGIQRRRLDLDAADIENGSVLYRPQSKDVNLALSLLTEMGSPLTEHIRVLDGTQQKNAAPLSATGSVRGFHLPDQAAGGALSATAVSSSKRLDAKTHQAEANRGVHPGSPGNQAPGNTPPVAFSAVQPAVARTFSSSSLDAQAEPVRAEPASTQARPVPSSMAQKPSVLRGVSRTVTPRTAAVSERHGPAEVGAAPAKVDLLLKKAAPSGITRELPSSPATGSGTTPVATKKSDLQSRSGYVQPKPLKQIMPDTGVFGISTLYEAKDVAVRVAIDDRGRVTQAEALNSGGKSTGLLTLAALAAAREWVFEPAQMRGVRVASEHTIVFRFAGGVH